MSSKTINLRSAALFQLKGNELRKECCRIKLADNRFYIGKTSCKRMQGHDVTITHRGQGHEAEIDQVCSNGEIIVKRRETGEGIWRAQRDEAIERYEDQSNTQIKQHRTNNAVEGDPPRCKHGACDHSAERDTQNQPRRGIQVNVDIRGCCDRRTPAHIIRPMASKIAPTATTLVETIKTAASSTKPKAMSK